MQNKDTRKVSSLFNWKDNPRAIKKDKFEELKNRIKRHDQIKPLIITDEGEVLGGNMRLRAFKELNIDEAWVSVVKPKNEAEKIEIALTDNEELGYYEDQALAELIDKYKDEIDLTLYSVHLRQPRTLEDILEEFSPEEIIEDEAPELPKKAESKLGEVYQLGRHYLMCGDSTNVEHVEKLMAGNKADMVFTDPPYGMFLNADFSDMKNNLDFAKDKGFKGGRKYDNVIGDHEDFNPDFINTVFSVFGYCKEIFLWGANYYSELLQDRNKGSWIVWDKRLEDSADKMYGSCFELCWSKGKHKQDIARVKWASVFGTEQEFDHKRHHPTQKPVKLSDWFISKYSNKNDNVVDLFGGSGSTLIACEQTDRTCYMMELDPRYCDVIIKRYNNFVNNRQLTEQ